MSRCRCGLEKVTTYDALHRPRKRCPGCDRVAPPRILHADEATPDLALRARTAPYVAPITHRRAAVIQFSSPTMPARAPLPEPVSAVSRVVPIGKTRPCLTCGATTVVRPGRPPKRCNACPPLAAGTR